MTDTTQHIPAAVQALAPVINQYGYLAVGGLITLEDFGIPVPGETVLIAAAFYSGIGHLNIFAVFAIGFIAAVIGDNIGYAIGRYGGVRLVERFGKYIFLTPERIQKAERFFSRNGGKIIVVARFIEGLRQANGIIAGLGEMKWIRFIFFNVIGAALWVGLWSAVGYFGGSHIDTFLRYQLYFTILVVVGLVGFTLYKFIRRRNRRTVMK
jgi:membrane protein DedA with SNARE-associated domain